MQLYRHKILSSLIHRHLLLHPARRRWSTERLVRREERWIQLFGAPLFVDSIEEIGYGRAEKLANENIVWRDEAGSLLSLACVLQDGDSFIDIGANVGLYCSCLQRIQHLYPGNEFYAFEANPETAKRLRQTLQNTNVTVIACALSDQETTLEFATGAVSGAFGASGR